jgi:ribosome-associated protein
MKPPPAASRELVKLCCRALLEKKAEDLRVLDVSDQSSLTDYLVLATGTSEPHLRAMGTELKHAMAAAQTRLVGTERTEESGWTVVDAFDVMVHLFSPEQRERYALESLWKDAKEVSVDELLDVVKPAPKPKPKPKPKSKPKSKLRPKAKAKSKPKAKVPAAKTRRKA